MILYLKQVLFSEKEEIIAQTKNMKAVAFRYESGIRSLKIYNKKGYVEILPYRGQMIWDAVFNGRSLKMKTPYTIPKKASSFLDTYGCYLMHCGALAMGCPSKEDAHPLHGELPYVEYDRAMLHVDEDEQGAYMAITGEYEYNRAFADHYIARPVVKLYENETLIDVAINIENASFYPMELMYMCHINHRPEVGGRIVQGTPWDDEHMELRYSIPQHVKVGEDFRAFLEKIKQDSTVTQVIREEDVYNPEVVFFIHEPKTDKEGFAHFMFVHPDGSADYTSYKPSELDHCSRWFVRTKNKEALGLALPGTADAEGYAAEKKKGNIKVIGPKSTFSAHFKTGYVNKENVSKMEKKINE